MTGTKNKLMDLNDHLFAQLETLADEELTSDKLGEEIDRSRAIVGIAAQIINNARLALDAQISIDDRLLKEAPRMLGVSTHEEKKKA